MLWCTERRICINKGNWSENTSITFEEFILRSTLFSILFIGVSTHLYTARFQNNNATHLHAYYGGQHVTVAQITSLLSLCHTVGPNRFRIAAVSKAPRAFSDNNYHGTNTLASIYPPTDSFIFLLIRKLFAKNCRLVLYAVSISIIFI